MADKVLYPWGAASTFLVAFAASMSLGEDVCNNRSIAEVEQMTGDGTLDLTLDDELRTGAEIFLKVSADGTQRTLTLGTGTDGSTVVVPANETVNVHLYFDGNQFNKL